MLLHLIMRTGNLRRAHDGELADAARGHRVEAQGIGEHLARLEDLAGMAEGQMQVDELPAARADHVEGGGGIGIRRPLRHARQARNRLFGVSRGEQRQRGDDLADQERICA